MDDSLPDKGKSGALMLILSQMSKEIAIRVIDKNCLTGSDVGKQKGGCTYCGSPTVLYIWCRRCMINIGLIKTEIIKAHSLETRD
jgi:hypothetical protein